MCTVGLNVDWKSQKSLFHVQRPNSWFSRVSTSPKSWMRIRLIIWDLNITHIILSFCTMVSNVDWKRQNLHFLLENFFLWKFLVSTSSKSWLRVSLMLWDLNFSDIIISSCTMCPNVDWKRQKINFLHKIPNIWFNYDFRVL